MVWYGEQFSWPSAKIGSIFNERKLVLGLVIVAICLSGSHKKFINSKILIEWINDF